MHSFFTTKNILVIEDSNATHYQIKKNKFCVIRKFCLRDILEKGTFLNHLTCCTVLVNDSVMALTKGVIPMISRFRQDTLIKNTLNLTFDMRSPLSYTYEKVSPHEISYQAYFLSSPTVIQWLSCLKRDGILIQGCYALPFALSHWIRRHYRNSSYCKTLLFFNHDEYINILGVQGRVVTFSRRLKVMSSTFSTDLEETLFYIKRNDSKSGESWNILIQGHTLVDVVKKSVEYSGLSYSMIDNLSNNMSSDFLGTALYNIARHREFGPQASDQEGITSTAAYKVSCLASLLKHVTFIGSFIFSLVFSCFTWSTTTDYQQKLRTLKELTTKQKSITIDEDVLRLSALIKDPLADFEQISNSNIQKSVTLKCLEWKNSEFLLSPSDPFITMRGQPLSDDPRSLESAVSILKSSFDLNHIHYRIFSEAIEQPSHIFGQWISTSINNDETFNSNPEEIIIEIRH